MHGQKNIKICSCHSCFICIPAVAIKLTCVFIYIVIMYTKILFSQGLASWLGSKLKLVTRSVV